MPDKLKKGWTKVAFGDVVKLSRERSRDPLSEGFERYLGLEHLDPEDLKIRRWGNVADGTTFTSVFRAGQVLFGKRRAYQKKLAVPDFDGVCSGDIYVLEPRNEHLLPELLPFICQTDSFFNHAVGTSAGSLSPRTNWKSLAEYEFALPPLDEQRRIAEVLNNILECIKKHHVVKCTLNNMMSAILYRLKNSGMSLNKSTVLGDYIEKIIGGGTPARLEKNYWGGVIPWMTVKDIPDSVYIETTQESITKEGLRNSSANLVPPNSIILATRIAVGKVVRNRMAVAINQDLKSLVPVKNVVDDYFFYWLQASEHDIIRRSAGTTVKGIRIDKLKEIPFQPPTLRVQTEFVNHLNKVNLGISMANEHSIKFSNLYKKFLLNFMDVSHDLH